MCNFIIRPIKSYATIDIYASKKHEVPAMRGKVIIKKGDCFEVSHIEGSAVIGEVNGTAGLAIPMRVFVHTFSDKKSEKEKTKTDEQESDK